MNFSDLKARCYQRLRLPTGGTDQDTRLGGFLNDAQNEILGKSGSGFSRLRRRTLAFTTVTDDPFVVLPMAAEKVYGIVNRVNMHPLRALSLPALRELDPGLRSKSGSPEAYLVYDYAAPTSLEPPAAGAALFAKSSSASDTAISAVVEGITTAGIPTKATVTLTGTTAVNMGSYTWLTVTKFYIASNTPVGDVTLHLTSGAGTQIGLIKTATSTSRYTRIQLWPTPSSAVVLYADCDIYNMDLVHNGDTPVLPFKFHWVLVERALMLELATREKSNEYLLARERYVDGIREMRMYLSTPQGDSESDRGFSQLGPYYPAGS